ncbi:MAG: nucleolar RNA-binding Nop10p family protein [Candidatus Nanohaloarchaea archaeon]|nr:nucleolar RNA-binding Nop10p family protein [Candidatus Nanohaloarchaea archaeon]
MTKVKKCGTCNRYTLRDECPDGHGPTSDPSPPPYSSPDQYAEYRQEAKQENDTA